MSDHQAHPVRKAQLALLAASGSTSWFRVRDYLALDSAVLTLFAYGTFGGGTLTLIEAADSSGNGAVTHADSLTAAGKWDLVVSPDQYFRLTLAGATGPSLTVIAL